MAQQIEVPGMGIVEFPDGMPDHEIAKAIAANQPKAKPQGGEELARVAGSAIYGGLTSLPRLAADVMSWAGGKQTDQGTWRESLRNAIGGADTAIREKLKPETKAGKVIANIGEAAVGGVAFPGGMIRPLASAGIGAAAGAGAETAAGVMGEDNALVRLAGGLAGGGAAGLAVGLAPNVNSLIKRDTRMMTPQHWEQAKQSHKILRDAGIAQLASQHLGPASTLAHTVEKASQNPWARPTLEAHLQNVPAQTREALKQRWSRELPQIPGERREVYSDIQGIAKGKDIDLVKSSNAAFEAAMPPVSARYSGQHVDDIRQQILDLANSPRYGANTPEGKELIRYAETFLPAKGKPTATGVLDSRGNPIMSPGVTQDMAQHEVNNLAKTLGALVGGKPAEWGNLPKKDLLGILKGATPEFDAARAAKRAVMEGDVSPFRQSVAGQISQMGGGPNENKFTATRDIAGMLFPINRAQPSQVRKFSKDLGPEALGQVLREHATTAFENAARGSNTTQTPAEFVKNFVGSMDTSSPQWQNIDAAYREIAKFHGQNPAAVSKGLKEFMHALYTYKDVRITPSTSTAATDFAASQSVGGFLAAAVSQLGRTVRERTAANTYQKLADMVTSPDGPKLLEAIARAPDYSAKAAVMRGVIASVMARDEEKSPGITNP